ncbi:MAG: adenine deaminase [Euryarchaeota archaeon]|nr:adenine deaminase [Euryarchaeota archaeon]
MCPNAPLQSYDDVLGAISVRHLNGYFVDVLSGAIYPACVNFYDGKIIRIDQRPTAPDQYILPGLVDSHTHIESSHLSPYRYAEQAILHGTTSVVTDPSPVCATTGLIGLEYMVEAGNTTPLKFHYTVPSDIPGLGWKEVRSLLSRDEFVALGEITDYEGLIEEKQSIMGKIEVARQLGKPIDGHAPGLRGFHLEQYIMSGITSDHESTTSEEALEKHKKGMAIALRESSSNQNLNALLPFARKNKHMLATDHLRSRDLIRGHIDNMLHMAVEGGVDPMQAVRAATLWPSQHYGLKSGALEIGTPADMTVVSDLHSFKVLETWIDGDLVARNGELLYLGSPPKLVEATFPMTRLDQIDIHVSGRVAPVKVICIGSDGEITQEHEELQVEDGRILADTSRDILYMIWVDPAHNWSIHVGFVRGFGLWDGAIATSEVHKFGGILCVATTLTNAQDLINEIIVAGGGSAAILGRDLVLLPLPIAGLMSDLPAKEVAAREFDLMSMTRNMGCLMNDPFLILSSLGTYLPSTFWAERTEMSVGAR